jgi:hypothetical protein
MLSCQQSVSKKKKNVYIYIYIYLKRTFVYLIGISGQRRHVHQIAFRAVFFLKNRINKKTGG